MNSEKKKRVVVVSNRLPWTLKRSANGWRTEQSTGGLATAMSPILEATGGIWIGWAGDASGSEDERRSAQLEKWRSQKRYFAVELPADSLRGFYDGFSNQTLWPLLHHFSFLVKFKPTDWRAYVEVNRRFCDAVLEQLQPGDLVWVHDYQLMLLPQMLRQAAPETNIGFFLHVPFASSAVFRILPRRAELLEGLLGADYIAFHTYGYLQHFRASLLRILGMDSQMDRVYVGGRLVMLGALPIGIAPEEFTFLLQHDAATSKRVNELRNRFGGSRVLLAVDRLDYTKGIPERLRTYRRLLVEAPELRGNVVLVQVAVPSRGRIPMYSQLRKEVDELVGKINGEFGTTDWSPIIYVRRGVPRSELAALYAIADVAWVTPLRDGLNLVCKEYVACKQGRDGVLVLSEMAGAASEMGEALLVNPFDEEQTASVIKQALEMSPEDRRQRMSALYRRVLRNNVFAWGDRFVNSLRAAVDARERIIQAEPQTLPIQSVSQAFARARSRLLLLDYDGTLVPFVTQPQQAVPPAELVDTLVRLAALPRTTIVLASGRPRSDLEQWFSRVERMWLAAEHGALLRPPQSEEWNTYGLWRSTGLEAGERRSQVLSVLDHFVDKTPGSFIEEKESSIVWHYRMSDPEFGEWLAHELVATLDQMLGDTDLRAVHGHKSVEIRPLWANKGQILNRLPEEISSSEFILAAGDDRTDEDLFLELPPESWTIHIGDGTSRARFRLPGPAQMARLLSTLATQERERPTEGEKLAAADRIP